MSDPTPIPDRRLADQLVAVAEQLRLRIIRDLAAGPKTVGRVAELVGVPVASVSHHLLLMKRVGVLANRKVGRTVEYTFAAGVFAPPERAGELGTLNLGTWRLSIGPDET
ncbi:ArsR/SmtB family transcription factor [Limnoglobus roseus]|uniref:ArsR family transcriptional regulator n=1 Tax=Limnoglobus roseus TaxID=2598579 RepID=A0A5C1APU2_9BACT|nr:metalloregulator ArsR/SmtB family transcription factor [Limnoglobus roseus]QEL20615.1 ArsR family transcriptional regulator [Limnoglobus roseus]